MKQWSAPLFGCFDDIGLCIKAYFVPCVVSGENAEAAGRGNCFLFGCVSLFGLIGMCVTAGTRQLVREQNDIEGNFCEDCLITMFCHCCSIIQVSRELSKSNPTTGQTMSRV